MVAASSRYHTSGYSEQHAGRVRRFGRRLPRRQVVTAGRRLLAARGMAEAAQPARATAGQRGLALAGEAR